MTNRQLIQALESMPDIPVLFELNVREWDGDFLFNPKRISCVSERILIELANGHCVTKSRQLVLGQLQRYAPDIPITLRVTDKNNFLNFEAVELAVEYVPDEMIIKVKKL